MNKESYVLKMLLHGDEFPLGEFLGDNFLS